MDTHRIDFSSDASTGLVSERLALSRYIAVTEAVEKALPDTKPSFIYNCEGSGRNKLPPLYSEREVLRTNRDPLFETHIVGRRHTFGWATAEYSGSVEFTAHTPEIEYLVTKTIEEVREPFSRERIAEFKHKLTRGTEEARIKRTLFDAF